jgi:hypothetical protein
VFEEFGSMIGSSFSIKTAVTRASRRAAWAAAAALVVLAPSARAQGPFFFLDPPPDRIERQLSAAGYGLKGPLMRRGDVYLAEVVTEMGDRERLVIDAHNARILERIYLRSDYRRYDRFGSWRDRNGDAPWDAPRPAPGFGQPHDEASKSWGDDYPPVQQFNPRDEFGLADPAAKPPTVLYGPDGLNGSSPSPGDTDKPKPKSHVARKRPAATASVGKATPSLPLATEAAPPNPPIGDGSKTASSPDADTKPVADDKPSSKDKPVAESKPSTDRPIAEAKASVEIKPAAEAKPFAEPKPAVDSKPAADKPVAEAKPVLEAKPAPQLHQEKKGKSVNDVPVNPLD